MMQILRVFVCLNLGMLVSGCDTIYPTVANNYSQIAEITFFDAKGNGGHLHELPPKRCLAELNERPKISKIVVKLPNEPMITYGIDDIHRALEKNDMQNGVFVVDEQGLHFSKAYKCESSR